MFCSGVKKYHFVLSVLIFFWYYYVGLIFNDFSLFFNKLGFNDSIQTLNTISSAIYTIAILIIVILYIQTLFLPKYTYIKVIFTLWSCTYFLDYNYILNNIKVIINTNGFNLNLQNGLVNIHPFFVYILYGWVYIHTMFNYFNKYTYKLKTNMNLPVINVCFVIVVGILLGAWWASQELNWGGYWSWDPVELISFLLFIFMCGLVHNQAYVFKKIYLRNYISTVLIVYFIMRLGVVTTIHSFIKNNNLSYYIYILSLSIPVIFTYTFFLENSSKKNIKNNSALHERVIFFFFHLFTIVIIFTLVRMIIMNVSFFKKNIFYDLNTCCNLIILLYVWLLISVFSKTKKPTSTVSLLLLFVFIFCNFIEFLGLIILLQIIMLFKRNDYKVLHNVLLLNYIVFLLYFVQTLTFFNSVPNDFVYLTISDISNNTAQFYCYEINFLVLKNNFFCNLKNSVQHVLGFNMYASIQSTYFLFSKNSQVYSMFTEEYIYTNFVTVLIAVIVHYNKLNKNKIVLY